MIKLEDGSEYLVTVACSLADLINEKKTTRNNLAMAIAVLALFNIASAASQVTAMLRPLSKMRNELSERDSEVASLASEDYPEEVAPLVDDINALLVRNREIVARGRRQAADLAHALKTPSAVLRNELADNEQCSAKPNRALEALDRIDAQIGRSLARMRASNSASTAGGLQTDLNASVDRLARLFCSMAKKAGRVVSVHTDDACTVFMDQHDLEETLGNLLENALKWSCNRISLSTRVSGGFVDVLIEDDGPGIPPDRRKRALEPGARLDTAVRGSGLGLAIAHDLIQAYGGELHLSESKDLGGLKAIVRLPRKKKTLDAEAAADQPPVPLDA